MVMCGLTVRGAMEICVQTGMSHRAYTALRHIMPDGLCPAIGKVTKLKKSLAPNTMSLAEYGVADGTMASDIVSMISRDLEVYEIVWSEVSEPMGQPPAPKVKATRSSYTAH